MLTYAQIQAIQAKYPEASRTEAPKRVKEKINLVTSEVQGMRRNFQYMETENDEKEIEWVLTAHRPYPFGLPPFSDRLRGRDVQEASSK